MAQLTIITETGIVPHSACRCTWGQDSGWWGFEPKTHRAPAGPGFVDRSDRTPYINHLVSFLIDDATLRRAIDKVAADYASAIYCVGVQDCVSFSSDVARAAGLLTPPPPIFTPYGLLIALAALNQHTEWS